MTKKVLKLFSEVSKIPRCSKNEDEIRQWLLSWSSERSLETKVDKAGNVLIRVPATKGFENVPTVVLQGHMDMVCEKTSDSKHDFSKDPIELIFDGDWLRANKTTLGADNGIAIAIALAFTEVDHPPLELLFTVDEETGLTGALNLSDDMLTGKILLNLDSEDEGIFTIGCAGGLNSMISLGADVEKITSEDKLIKIKVSGLKGGHSGIDIHKNRGNAIKELSRILNTLSDFSIVEISGGTAHNAIPRDAYAIVAVSKDFDKFDFELVSENFRDKLTKKSSKKIVNFLNVFPSGVYVADYENRIIDTSNNLAKISLMGGEIKLLSSQRGATRSNLEELTSSIRSLVELFGGSMVNSDGYPAWEPCWNSDVLKLCKEVYTKRFNREPLVEVVHAGLECGIIGSKYDNMDMISFGPTIKNPHSPDESLRIGDIDKICDFMVELFDAMRKSRD